MDFEQIKCLKTAPSEIFEQIKCLKTALSEIPDGPLDALQKLDSILDSATGFFAEIRVFWAVFTENELQWIEQHPYKIKDFIVLQKRRERRKQAEREP